MGVRALDLILTSSTALATLDLELTRGTLTSAQVVKTVEGESTPTFSYCQISLHHNDNTAPNRIAYLTAGNVLQLYSIGWDGTIPIDETMLLVLTVLGYSGDTFRFSAIVVDPITGATGFVRDP